MNEYAAPISLCTENEWAEGSKFTVTGWGLKNVRNRKYLLYVISGSVLNQICQIYHKWQLWVQSRTPNSKAWFRYLASLVRRFWEM